MFNKGGEKAPSSKTNKPLPVVQVRQIKRAVVTDDHPIGTAVVIETDYRSSNFNKPCV